MIARSIFISLGLLLSTLVFSQRLPDREKYIKRYKDIAIREMERTGVPASIKLAQGLLESNAGKSVLARKAKNHFGVKCGSNWKGKTFYREDDDYDSFGNILESCFRVYRNAEASFIAHSEFLRDPRKEYRYGFLFRLDPQDYKRWAYGLKRAGYATNPNYPKLLINLIETYELYKYDTPGGDTEPIAEDVPPLLEDSGIFLVNGAKVVLAEAEDTPGKIANRTGVAVYRIIRYNELLDSDKEKIKAGARVFLQRKRSFFRGRQKWHYVKEGETMFSISQKYGVRLEKLYKKNRMEPGTEPAVGEKIKLRWRVRKGERPRLRTEVPIIEEDLDMETPDVELDEETPPVSVDESDVPSSPQSGWDASPVTDDTTIEDSFSGDEVTPPPTDNNSTPKPVYVPEPVTNNTTTSTPTTPVPDTPIPSTNNTDELYHKVARGDTLYKIARHYGTTVEAIKRMNQLHSDLIRSGWMLRVK
ncbi:MAG TPA: LysM peptidoglycan-binding domain-containing protein [Saprospiraceae bacterium]|nr:LysM peptidoglycan-binding domain-containing protein [Saprospiraceae bacterium]